MIKFMLWIFFIISVFWIDNKIKNIQMECYQQKRKCDSFIDKLIVGF